MKQRIGFRIFSWVRVAAGFSLLTPSFPRAQELPPRFQETAAFEARSFSIQSQPAQAGAPQQQGTAPLPVSNTPPPCIQPAPMVRVEDYNGPFRKVVGTFVGRFERATAHLPHTQEFKPGAILCTLPVKAKFVLFLQDSLDPGTFLSAGFDAALSQAQNNDPSYGQGAQGYGKRFGADLAGQASSRFFNDFAYPSIFSEDPRYYRLWHGSAGRRLFHAAAHSVLAHRDNGETMFNFSEWLGTASTVVLSNTYHPDNRRGFAPAAERFGYAIAGDVGFDILREFWPDISRKFKLPFRGEPAAVIVQPNPPPK